MRAFAPGALLLALLACEPPESRPARTTDAPATQAAVLPRQSPARCFRQSDFVLLEVRAEEDGYHLNRVPIARAALADVLTRRVRFASRPPEERFLFVEVDAARPPRFLL